MGDRRTAREYALQALCYFDIQKGAFGERYRLFCDNFKDEIPNGIRPFFTELVEGVMAAIGEIDAVLEKSSKNWRISRMPIVDRNVMRIAAFEILKRDDVPHSVSINEAVEIGKKFGAHGSGAFINGVLDQVRLTIESTKEMNRQKK